MEPILRIRGLAKSYRIYQKREGLWAAMKGLFRREYREVQAVRDFNEHMAGVKELQSVIVPIGDGLWVGVKK